jgi:hypothetical protein
VIARLLLAATAFLLLAGAAEAKKPKPPPEESWRIILYKSPDFQDDALDLASDMAELEDRDFDGNVSSFVIVSGYWQLCEKEFYKGFCVELGPGSYPNMGAAGLSNNELESVRRMKVPAPPVLPKPDLARSVEARAGYDATIEGEGDARLVTEVVFRGVTVRVTVTNKGASEAAASTLRIEPGGKMSAVASYIAAGEHECGAGKFPWPAKEGRQITCTALGKGELAATANGTAMTCAVPKLQPGGSARCVAVFSVLYNYLVPQFGDWYVVATVDAGKKVGEENEKNNGAGDQIRVKGDDLPPP